MESGAALVTRGGEANGSPDRHALTAAAVAARQTWDRRPYEVPRGHRISGATLATLAAVTGLAAIALGLWAFIESTRDDGATQPTQTASAEATQALSLLSKPTTVRLPFPGAEGWLTLAVASNGRGFLVLDGIEVAPLGRTYQAWVVPRGTLSEPLPAAVFSGIEGVVPLTARVRRGFVVGITVERHGGAPAPTKAFRLAVER